MADLPPSTQRHKSVFSSQKGAIWAVLCGPLLDINIPGFNPKEHGNDPFSAAMDVNIDVPGVPKKDPEEDSPMEAAARPLCCGPFVIIFALIIHFLLK